MITNAIIYALPTLIFIVVCLVLHSKNQKLQRKYDRMIWVYEGFIEQEELRKDCAMYIVKIENIKRLASRVHAIPKDDLFHRDTK